MALALDERCCALARTRAHPRARARGRPLLARSAEHAASGSRSAPPGRCSRRAAARPLARGDRDGARPPTSLNTAIKLVVRRPRPALAGPAAADAHADAARLPERARDQLVRGARASTRGRRCRAAPLYALACGLAARACTSASTIPPTSSRGRCSAARSARSAPSPGAGAAVSMRIGIVGLPNAGKSSLFNALTQAGAEAANYPFTTIEPNVAVVGVRDERLDAGRARRSAPARSSTTRSTSTTSPASSRARTAARASATASSRTSARPTRSCTSCARTATRTSSTPRAASTRSATSRRSRPS